MSELIYDFQNKAFLTGRSRRAASMDAEAASNIQASDDDEDKNQALRSIQNAYSQLIVELSESDQIPSAAALFCRRVTQEGERHHSSEFQTAEPCREAGTPDLSPRQCQFAWSHQPFLFSSCRLSESGQEDGGGVGDGAGFHQCRTRAPEQSAGQEFRAL